MANPAKPRSPRKKRDAVEPPNIHAPRAPRLALVRRKEALQAGAPVPASGTTSGTTAHAIAVFGDPAKALDWLKTPTHVFGGKSPEEYASSGGGDEVERILTRIEYGVFS